MARPLRVHFEGAIYHVTSRGNERKNIVRSDKDRELFIKVLAQMLEDHRVVCHAWVLMDNHFHLLLETPEANLSRAIRHLNGVYTQKFNKGNHRIGHLFQGRYKAILVEKGTHLLELCRYVVLNPIRARMAKRPGEWKWSSYRATAGIEKKEPWLTTDWVLSQFGANRKQAERRFRKFVLEGMKSKKCPWDEVHGAYYGGEELKGKLKEIFKRKKRDLEVPLFHHRLEKHDPDRVLESVAKAFKLEVAEVLKVTRRPNAARDVAIWLLRKESGLSLREIGEKLGVRYSAIGNRMGVLREKAKEDLEFQKKLSDCKVKT